MSVGFLTVIYDQHWSLFGAAVRKQPHVTDLHNSFNLIQGEQVINQWLSEECVSACCAGVHYTTLTNQRIVLRHNGCTVCSCLCGCCCDRPYQDQSIFLHQISEMDTQSISCFTKLQNWMNCRCPQDGIYFHGAFHGSCFAPGYRVAYFTTADRPQAQIAIADAIANAHKRH